MNMDITISYLTMFFVILAGKTASQRKMALDHIRNRDWPVSARPFVCVENVPREIWVRLPAPGQWSVEENKG